MAVCNYTSDALEPRGIIEHVLVWAGADIQNLKNMWFNNNKIVIYLTAESIHYDEIETVDHYWQLSWDIEQLLCFPLFNLPSSSLGTQLVSLHEKQHKTS